MKEQGKQPNVAIRYEREMRGWSQQVVASYIGTTEQVVCRWESGAHRPNRHFQAQLCKLFGKSAEELGFLEKTQTDTVPGDIIENTSKQEEQRQNVSAVSLLSSSYQVVPNEVNKLLAFLLEETMREQMSKDNDSQHADVEKRQLLFKLLATAGTTVLSPTFAITTDSSLSIPVEEFALQCSGALKACWHLLKGKGLPVAEEMLAVYVPSLITLMQQRSCHLEVLAELATEAKILQAILAMHNKLNLFAREMYCHEAVKYGQISGNKRLHAAALIYLAYTYTCCIIQPEKATTYFLEALKVLGDEKSILHGKIYIGISSAYAQSKQEKSALNAIELAHEYFPDHPELDPSVLYADYGRSEIYQGEGRMYLDLAKYYPDRHYAQKAYDAFTHSLALHPLADRTAAESIIHQADAACGISDLHRYVELLTEGTHMAFSLGSQKRYSEAFDIYWKTSERWKNEPQIQRLAKNLFQQPPRKGAGQ
ncbi:hypothetical protein KSF_110370 [Reticulibacter mediterranei]|uniref:HTH cro/C1-type domain-containing protein n=1 Tax=Reticulibacter mediterranei TaxID=2778369 RepID=A0A8J3N798_9CHLR|nr:helix-turn-helix transcriptional regulator [Reticulibacter mediterranei]GHP00990.1 hypothetical protein KSF_110370 [Reticulibacter mediterranei]